MIKLKKLKSPLRFLGIKRYKGTDGIHWIKFGNGPRRPVNPRWFVLSKWTMIFLIIGIIGFTGYRIGFTYISGKMMDQLADQMFTAEEIEEWKNDPQLQQLLADHADFFDKAASDAPSAPPATAPPSQTGGDQPPAAPVDQVQEVPAGLAVSTKEEASKLLLSKFSMAELVSLADKARDGLSDTEKTEIKDTLLERLTDDEFEAIKIIAIKEISKR